MGWPNNYVQGVYDETGNLVGVAGSNGSSVYLGNKDISTKSIKVGVNYMPDVAPGWGVQGGNGGQYAHDMWEHLPVSNIPLKGKYQGDDQEIIDAQLAEMRDYGIDFVMVDWFFNLANAESTTDNTIAGSGSKTFYTNPTGYNCGFQVGMTVLCTGTVDFFANTIGTMTGTVSSYNPTTGQVDITIASSTGAGSAGVTTGVKSGWTIQCTTATTVGRDTAVPCLDYFLRGWKASTVPNKPKLCLIYANKTNRAYVTTAGFTSHFANAINTYFNDPNYLKIDGKPVVSFVDTWYTMSTGIMDTIPLWETALAGIKTQTIAAGYPDLYIVAGLSNITSQYWKPVINKSIVDAIFCLNAGPRYIRGTDTLDARVRRNFESVINQTFGEDDYSSGAVLAGCTISGTTLTITSVTSGVVAAGQYLYGNGIVEGTTISSGAGLSWTINNAHTIPLSTSMYSAIPYVSWTKSALDCASVRSGAKKLWLPVSAGWDISPEFNITTPFNGIPTLEQFSRITRTAVQTVKDNPAACDGFICFQSWSEYYEQSIVEPTVSSGFDKLQIIKDMASNISINKPDQTKMFTNSPVVSVYGFGNVTSLSSVPQSGLVNTNKANLFVAMINHLTSAGTVTLGDTINGAATGNVWIPLTTRTCGAGAYTQKLYYCVNPITGPNHEFTVNSTSNMQGLFVVDAFRTANTVPFDLDISASGGSVTTISSGSLTPSIDGSLIIATSLVQGAATVVGIDTSSGFSASAISYTPARLGGGFSYKVQTSKSAENPVWTFTGGSIGGCIATLTAFKPGV